MIVCSALDGVHCGCVGAAGVVGVAERAAALGPAGAVAAGKPVLAVGWPIVAAVVAVAAVGQLLIGVALTAVAAAREPKPPSEWSVHFVG